MRFLLIGLVSAIFMGGTSSATERDGSLRSFRDFDQTVRRLDLYFGKKDVFLFGKGGAVDQMIYGLEILEEGTPYVADDMNVLLAGHPRGSETRRAAVLFSPTGEVLAVGALFPVIDDKKTTYRLAVITKTKGGTWSAIRKWGEDKVRRFTVEQTSLADWN